MLKRVFGLAIVLLMIGSGCATSSFQTARTNGAGNFQLGVEPGVIGAQGAGLGLVAPSFNIAGRYGISDGVDLGARIGTLGYEVQAKIALNDHSDHGSLALALAPGVTAIGAGGSGAGFFLLAARIPFLIGIPVGDSEFTIGPRLEPTFIAAGGGGSGAGGFGLTGGLSLGFAARLGNTFWLMPEASFSTPLFGAVAAGGSTASGVSAFDVIQFNAGLALLFGGRGTSDGAPPSAAPPIQ